MSLRTFNLSTLSLISTDKSMYCEVPLRLCIIIYLYCLIFVISGLVILWQWLVFCVDQPDNVVSANIPSSPGDGVFSCLARPDHGREGRPIYLRANHFKIKLPNIDIFHYEVTITPEKCPRRVNREVIDTMFRANSNIFPSGHKPVYDGRKNLYSKNPLIKNIEGTVSLALIYNSQLICD